MEAFTPTPGSIVVGIDGSDSAERALLWAAEQAQLEKRPLTILHVSKPISAYELGWLATAGTETEDVIDGVRAEGLKLLEDAKERIAWKVPDVEVTTSLHTGDAREVLLDASSSAVLVVVGSRGRGPVRTLLLGSVSVAISRYASCPVVVVRPHHPGVVRHGVLVGTDCTDGSAATLEFAYREASLRRMPLTVLYCFLSLDGPKVPFGIVPDDQPGVEEQRLLLAENVSGMAEKFPDVHVRLELGYGLTDELLAEASRTMDLVVVGHHGTSFVDELGVGAVATSVVEHASGPVAVVTTRTSAPQA